MILWGIATGIIKKEVKNTSSRLKSESETANLVLGTWGNENWTQTRARLISAGILQNEAEGSDWKQIRGSRKYALWWNIYNWILCLNPGIKGVAAAQKTPVYLKFSSQPSIGLLLTQLLWCIEKSPLIIPVLVFSLVNTEQEGWKRTSRFSDNIWTHSWAVCQPVCCVSG